MDQAIDPGDGPATFEGMTGRGSVDTVLRTTQQTLSELSAQADLKANIIITAAALLLTVSITRIGDENLRVGTIILSLGCTATLVLAILAVLPVAAMRRVVHKDGNPIYFMEAAAMDRPEFQEQLARACQDDGALYGMVAAAIYSESRFLAHSKYRRLGWAYVAFLTGVVAAAVYQAVVELT
jgi:hypothetical protein